MVSVYRTSTTDMGEQVVFWLTALHAAAIVNSQSARECFLSDQSETLCDRAACAKQRSDDSEWWRDQLASASVTGTGTVQFVVLAMQQFMPIEPMLALSDEISDALDRLSDSAWHQLSSLEVPTRSFRRRRFAPLQIAPNGGAAHRSTFPR
jgi:hypothetical protein